MPKGCDLGRDENVEIYWWYFADILCIGKLRHDTCIGNIGATIFPIKLSFFADISVIHRYFHDISVVAPMYRCPITPFFFFPKTLLISPGPTLAHASLAPAWRALHAYEPSSTPRLHLLVLWIVDVGFQEVEFLKVKENPFEPPTSCSQSPTNTSRPTMLLLIKCTYYIYE